MKLFHISCTTLDDMHVFAPTFDDAAGVFVGWALANGHEAPTFTIGQVTLRSKGVELHHLRAALAIGGTGIGRYDPAIGWAIEPPEDERA